jgi:hypothetical protein
MDDAQVKAALAGATNLASPSFKRPKCKPFTIALIEWIPTALDTTKPLNAAVAAGLTTTFYTIARTGEFTVPAIDKFDPAIHVKHSNIQQQTDHHGLEVTVFALPRTKCSLHGEDWAIQDGTMDPNTHLKNHLTINDPL